MRYALALLPLLVLLCARPTGATEAIAPQASNFTVEALVDKSSLPAADRKLGLFRVLARVTNTSGRDQELLLWTDSGWSWASDNTLVRPDVEALQNFPQRRFLEPGRSYTTSVLMRYRSDTAYPPQRFRLGFVPRAALPASGRRNPLQWGGIYWSNELYIDENAP